MTRLSVNVNKLATLRNSRGKNTPNLAVWVDKIIRLGAYGITVHPRPDGRHIRFQDVRDIHSVIYHYNCEIKSQVFSRNPVELNIEGYPSPEFLELMEQIKPDQCTLVPDPPEALTSNAGWDLKSHEAMLRQVLRELHQIPTRTSLFIDPKTFTDDAAAALVRLKPGRIELYTEAYADHFAAPERETVTATYKKLAEVARRNAIGVNAGHDLNQNNLGFLLEQIPWIDEVSIGHALICEALEQGMSTTLANYTRILTAK